MYKSKISVITVITVITGSGSIVTALALVTAGSYASSGAALGHHKKFTLTTSNSLSNNDLILFACQSKAAKNSPVTQA